MKIKTLVIGVVSLLLFSSCATIFGGKNNTINISGNTGKCEVFLDGEFIGMTPIIKMRISKYELQQGSIIEIKKEGYQTFTYKVERRPHVGYVLLNIIGGSIPLVVDVANGNIYRPNTRDIHFELQYDTLGTIEKRGSTILMELNK